MVKRCCQAINGISRKGISDIMMSSQMFILLSIKLTVNLMGKLVQLCLSYRLICCLSGFASVPRGAVTTAKQVPHTGWNINFDSPDATNKS